MSENKTIEMKGKMNNDETTDSYDHKQDCPLHHFEALTATVTLPEHLISVRTTPQPVSSSLKASKSSKKKSVSKVIQPRFPGLFKRKKKPLPPKAMPPNKSSPAEVAAAPVQKVEDMNFPLSISSSSSEDEPSSDIFLVNYKSHPKMIEMMLSGSLFNPSYSDILLGCDNEVFHCHRLVLAAASQHLAQLMEKTTALTPTSQQVVMLGGVRPIVLKNLLEFIYKGNAYVMQENIDDFIKIGNELKIEGLYVANVSPSASSTTLDNNTLETKGTGNKEGNWFGNRGGGSINCPSSVVEYLSTEIDETLPQSTFAFNDSRTLTATSDISFDDDEDDFKPSMRSKASLSVSEKGRSQVVGTVTSSNNSSSKRDASTNNKRKSSSVATTKTIGKTNQVADPLDIIKIQKKWSNENENSGNCSVNQNVNLNPQELLGQLKLLEVEMGRSKEGEQFILTSPLADNTIENKPKSLSESTVTSRTPRPPMKRVLSANITSNSGYSNSGSTPAAARKRSKRNNVTAKQTKEEKERNEKNMELAIKMAMSTHNVVRSATTCGVATSTLRGRLKKLGYCPPPKPTPTSARQSSQVDIMSPIAILNAAVTAQQPASTIPTDN